jgi:hypothetical protein
MGITVHWRGHLRSRDDVSVLVQTVRDFAIARRWRVRDIAPKVRELMRVVDKEVITYSSLSSGISVRPHRDCEAVTFEFDSDGYTVASCKTQFAGVQIHIEVVDLLSAVAHHFRDLDVFDEGGYWGTNDAGVLAERLGAIDRAISVLADHLCDPDAPDDESRGTVH